MDSDVRAGDARVQTPEAHKNNWLVCRAALHLFGLSCLAVAAVPLMPATAFSQTTGAAIVPVGTTPEAFMRPTLKPGSRGSEVTELQATLKLLGYYGSTVDGVYGQSTVAAVAQFQQAAGLNADGVAGPATWNRLFPAAVGPARAAAPTPAANTASLPPASGSASFPTPSGVSPAPSSTTPAANPRPAKPVTGTTPSQPATQTRPAATNNPSATEPVALPVLRQGMKGSAVVALQERLRSLGVLRGAADGVFGAETLAAVKAAQRRFKLDPDGIVGGGTWSALLR